MRALVSSRRRHAKPPCRRLSFLALAFGPAAAQQPKKALWGAIAYSTKTGAYGYAVDYATKRAAETEAFRICGTNCDLVRSFRNSCAAVATREKRVASDTGASREIAQAKAPRSGDRHRRVGCTKGNDQNFEQPTRSAVESV
jgi:hypothetical protein